MKHLILGLFFLLIANDLLAEEVNWYKVTANTLIVLDWAQTREIAINPAYIEKNKYLGTHPTTKEVNKYFIMSLLTTNIVGEYLIPEKYKNTWYGVVVVDRVGYVAHNYNIGIGFRF